MSWTRPTLAAAYASRGWPVFPLHSPGNGPSGCDCRRACERDAAKHPRTRHGLSDATTNIETVERWWRMWPIANIGLVTGATSGLVVLDVDPRASGDQSLARLIAQQGRLPETPCVWTGGGGLHYYFAHPGRKVKNSAGKLGPGLDIRGDGGYVVAPPSIHVTGKPYEWAVATDPVPLPAWLLTRIDDRSAHRPIVPRVPADVLSGVPEGERDDQLFRLAAKLRAADVPREVTEELILGAAENCVPPFPPDAALRKVASAYDRYEPEATGTRRRGLVNLR